MSDGIHARLAGDCTGPSTASANQDFGSALWQPWPDGGIFTAPARSPRRRGCRHSQRPMQAPIAARTRCDPIRLDAAVAHASGQVRGRRRHECACRLRRAREWKRLGVDDIFAGASIPGDPRDVRRFEQGAVGARELSARGVRQERFAELYDDEVARYEELVTDAQARGAIEPDYGTYVIDHAHGDLYLVAPERWHRLALVTSNSKLAYRSGGMPHLGRDSRAVRARCDRVTRRERRRQPHGRLAPRGAPQTREDRRSGLGRAHQLQSRRAHVASARGRSTLGAIRSGKPVRRSPRLEGRVHRLRAATRRSVSRDRRL